MLFIALAIKLTDGGAVFYTGERVGRGKRVFRIYKFRTLAEGIEKHIGGRLLSEEDRALYCTKIGRFLRRTKLDELPQLLNVIRGEMRLVGPRPVRPVFLEQFEREIPNYAARFLVPPGLTGIAQLRGGYFIAPRHRLRYDLLYITHRSLLFDLQIILLTFVKILDRWLSRGFFVLFLFLLVSFTPTSVQPFLSFSLFGVQMNLVNLLIVFVAGWLFFMNGPKQFSLYQSPLNLPVLVFLVFHLVSTLFAENPLVFLQQAGYQLVTGFLVALLIVNTFVTKTFFTLAVRIIALTSVVISLLGLLQVSMLLDLTSSSLPFLHDKKLLEDYARMSSILDKPIILSVYLVLGIPLLLAEVIQANTQRGRDFWLVCTTLSCVGIFFTQTRIGLLALLVTGTVFLSRRPRYALAFSSILLAGFLFVMSLGIPRFSPAQFGKEVKAWAQETGPVLHSISFKQWLVGGEVMTESPLGVMLTQYKNPQSTEKQEVEIANMHLALALEYGVVGWLIIMWLILSAVWAMKQSHDRTRDERLKVTLWAIISSIVGFLVSMNGMNTFHNLTLQVFFWSLIGIGLGIVTHLSGQRRRNLIWRFSVVGAGGD
jgi:lipopolysaccharide/colanic/teichoic acid biosynthesis glycosyltransferase